MQLSKAIAIVSLVFLMSSTLSRAQTTRDATEFDQLKSLVISQQKTLEHQQAQIEALQQALAEQKEMLANALQRDGTDSSNIVSAVYHPSVETSIATKPQAPQNPPPSDQEPLTPEQQKVEEELQRGPEIADVTPDTPAVKLGPAKVRLIGYPALTAVYRSTNSGGNVGTSFTSIPFDNGAPGNTSEFRLSPQSTRLAIRVDADLQKSRAAGYFEMDFGGTVPGNVAVTSSSYGFRIRQAWFDYAWGKYELTAGQLFSLMTPEKTDILPWPGDVATTQVIDTNYVAGLVQGRYPQVRFVYHASKATAFGFSLENPEQQVGSGSASGVIFPAGLSSILTTQYNTGSNELKVPNMTPDFVLKAAFNGKLAGRTTHLDVGTVFRVFRNYAPTSTGSFSEKSHAGGFGVNADFSLEVLKNTRLVLNGFYGYGAGRYIGGLVPDVIVKANGNIQQIPAYSWVSGFEIAPNKATGFYVYYSGVYGQNETTVDTNGKFIGWGYPGGSNAADRIVSEITGGYSRVFWKHENLGSVQAGFQYSYLWLQPWSTGGGPNQAQTNMFFSQLRYNLP